MVKSREQTTGISGEFGIHDIEPGLYMLIETDPTGYVSTKDTNEITLYIIEGQTIWQEFRDVPETPTPTTAPTRIPTPTTTSTPTQTATPEQFQIYTPLVQK